VDLPLRCASCKNYKECHFRTSAITFKEDQEYQVILEWLKFDEDIKKCLFFIHPSEMQDNYHQVKSYTENIEKRLIKRTVQGYCGQRGLQGVDQERLGGL
jgi:hypothetical protein